jgi:chlorite dismutase
MAEPIYKFFMARFSEAWYQLSEEERQSLKAKHDEAFEKAGAKRPIICDSSWSSDQWSFAGVEEFPNIEAVQNYMAALSELNWFRYIEATSVLGTKFEIEIGRKRSHS